MLSSVTAAVHAAEQLQAKGAAACQVASVAVEPLVVVTASFLTEQAVVHMLYTLSYLVVLHLPWRNQVQQQQTTDNQYIPAKQWTLRVFNSAFTLRIQQQSSFCRLRIPVHAKIPGKHYGTYCNQYHFLSSGAA